MTQITILIIGDHGAGSRPHEATREALLHAAELEHVVVNTRWLDADDLFLYPGAVTDASGLVLAPHAPASTMGLPESLIDALRVARTQGIPCLVTGEAHGLALVELGRNVLGMVDAGSTRYTEDVHDPVVTALFPDSEPARGTAAWAVQVEIGADPVVAPLYGGPGIYTEQSDVRHAVSPDYAAAIEEAGFRTAGILAGPARPILHVLEEHPWYVAAGFLPQSASRPGTPHPLFRGLIAAARLRARA